jgi:hypothetical protein
MDLRKPTALLLGENEQIPSFLSDTMKKYGCVPWFATSIEAARSLLGIRQFDLVLSPMKVHADSVLSLMNLLDGSGVSLFGFQPVEESCWWLPILFQGRNCFGSNALRPDEFAVVLKQVIRGARARLRMRTAVDQSSVRHRRNSVIALPRAEARIEPASPVSTGGLRFSISKAAGSR